MDPDEALRQLRAAIEKLKSDMRSDDTRCYDLGDSADEVIVAFEALDGWLSNGGFAPKDWKNNG